MAGRNQQVIDKAFKGYAEHIDKVVYSKLDNWCVEILRKAVFSRLNPVGGHNFTGNLINSIVVILYRRSNNTKTSYFASDQVRLPVRREISALNSRGKRRKNKVWLRPDWTGQYSSLQASELVPTDESWGQNDAVKFSKAWRPKNTNADFSICIAYTSEYASFVEYERQTTGILEVEEFVGRSAIEWVGLKAA